METLNRSLAGVGQEKAYGGPTDSLQKVEFPFSRPNICGVASSKALAASTNVLARAVEGPNAEAPISGVAPARLEPLCIEREAAFMGVGNPGSAAGVGAWIVEYPFRQDRLVESSGRLSAERPDAIHSPLPCLAIPSALPNLHVPSSDR